MPSPSKALAASIDAAGAAFDLPPSLLAAWSYAATGWSVSAYRYEPNLDRVEVAGKPKLWRRHPEWMKVGPSCEEFFWYHPDRESDWVEGRDYQFVAQEKIAAGYGPFLLRYPVALKHGYTGAPHDLQSLEDGVHWAACVLRGELSNAESLGRRGVEALAFGVMCVGGRVPSRSQVVRIDNAHLELYGQSFFGEE